MFLKALFLAGIYHSKSKESHGFYHLFICGEDIMHTLLSHDWSFTLLPLGSTLEDTAQAQWVPVDLPHDWLIADTDHLYRDGDGWYRRRLIFSSSDLSGHIFLSFDGVYMDADILLNGAVLFTEHYGYAPFIVDLTPFALEGENELLVHVRHQAPNSRWYSGAGIYRDVELLTLPDPCILPDSISAQPIQDMDGSWSLHISADLLGPLPADPATLILSDGQNELIRHTVASEHGHISMTLPCPAVQPWSPSFPQCYSLLCRLGDQEERLTVGFRTLRVDPDHGFFLNGEHIKLHGVCLHHDLGCLGAAFHPEAARRQLRRLMEIGVNALRTSHNPPARQLLDLCDQLGLLVMDEAFDMWEGSKTTYDYARFFRTHAAEDLTRMVRRDRNHPCVVFWSIGNEIHDTHLSPKAPRMTRYLRDAVRCADPDGHALITLGSNYMPWEGAQNCADVLKIAGYNYAEKLYQPHHLAHPDWVIFGSETASILSSRGIYHFPISKQILSDEDEQCSALGNSCTSWGHHSLSGMLADDLNCTFSLGQFVWSGIDYIGEPTPYHTRSCYFGLFDTAVFPKDSAWQYRAAWTDAPFVHIGVTWSWNPGQMIDVPVMTNLPLAELFIGDRSLGVQEVNVRQTDKGIALWHLPYCSEPLRVHAWDPSGISEADDVRYPFGDSAALQILREETSCGSLSFLSVSALDAEGHPVENAVDLVTASVDGPARILGMDNGDSTDRDNYQTDSKRLFSGKLLIILQALADHGSCSVKVTAPGLKEASITLPLNAQFHGEAQSGLLPLTGAQDQRIYARAIRLTPRSSPYLTPDHPSVTFDVRVFPENSFAQDLHFRITNQSGIDSPCAKAEYLNGQVIVTGFGDADLFLRATVSNGDTHARVISQYEVHVSGFGSMSLDPYTFLSGGLYDLHQGDIAPGNEQGFAFARDGVSMAGFTHLDFGTSGSDRITMPIFALDSNPHRIRVYTSPSLSDDDYLTTLTYCKPSIWNVYQEETWTLPRALTGMQTLCFVSDDKVHVKGFIFEKQSRAWRCLKGSDADGVWGDAYSRDGEVIRDIGNNVTVEYAGMDLGTSTSVTLSLTGTTALPVQPITVHVLNAEGTETVSLCSFAQSLTPSTQRFSLPVPGGLCSVSFVFLPGSSFSFYSFQLAPERKGEDHD